MINARAGRIGGGGSRPIVGQPDTRF
jgi:hypothetical protein